MSELEDFFSDIATAEAKVEKNEEPSIENERSDVAQNQTVAAAESSKPKTAVTGKRKAEASVDPPPPAQAYVPPPPAQAQVPPPPAAKEDSHKKPRAAPAVKLASHHLPSFGVGSSSSSLKVPPPPLVDGANDQGLLFKTIKEAKVEHKQSDKSAARATKTASTRIIAGQKWQDESMLEWPENDFRMFVGNIDPSVVGADLDAYFKGRYQSVAMTKVIMETRGQKSGKSRGYGFVSFLDAMECAKAIRTENGNFLGPRPMQIKKSEWKSRDVVEVHKKEKKKIKMLKDLGVLD